MHLLKLFFFLGTTYFVNHSSSTPYELLTPTLLYASGITFLEIKSLLSALNPFYQWQLGGW